MAKRKSCPAASRKRDVELDAHSLGLFALSGVAAGASVRTSTCTCEQVIQGHLGDEGEPTSPAEDRTGSLQPLPSQLALASWL